MGLLIGGAFVGFMLSGTFALVSEKRFKKILLTLLCIGLFFLGMVLLVENYPATDIEWWMFL